MRRCFAHAAMIALAVPVAAAAAPGHDVRSLSLPAQPLSATLQAIAERYGVELLFSQSLVGNRSAPPVTSRLTVQQALDLVLAGTSLRATRTADGGFIIGAEPVAVSQQPEVTPEILVVGRRTQNTDVRRTENDVRPYQVVTRDEIATSHVATVEELAAKRLPANAQGATLSQEGAGAQGEAASSINLRGLGTSETLILVDGRRLPQMPSRNAGLIQSDVNAIPPEALERVEAITATAGGIYGPGATAGVVNLVLRRDYRGIDAAITSGLTERGDAPYRRVDLRFGFTPDHGATDVMIDVSRSVFGGLKAGDRDYLLRANARAFANDPDYFIEGSPPPSASLTVVSADGRPLTFKPSYGGAALGSAITFAPPADGRSTATLVQTLTANSGSIDPTPSPNQTGSEETLLSGRRTLSVIASARHRAGPLELFVDYLRLDNRGRAQTADLENKTVLAAADPQNPFTQDVAVYAPDPVEPVSYDFRDLVQRITGGLIIDLPRSWRGEADYSGGSGVRSYIERGRQLTEAGIYEIYGQAYGGGPRNPLSDYSTYLASFDGLSGDLGSDFRQRNRFDDLSLRLAGPVARLGGGNLTATLLAERRNERVIGGTEYQFSPLLAPFVQVLPDYAQLTRSLYGELRAPLIDAVDGFRALRGLEVQLAIRRDWTTSKAVQDAASFDGGGTRTVRDKGLVYTAGFKASPLSGLLIRGSMSTGQQPLSLDDLTQRTFPGFTFMDPKRPGDIQEFSSIIGGPTSPKPARARSLSIGIVVQPPHIPSLRFSVDFTHIAKRDERATSVVTDDDYFIANESSYPGRVTRLPLTAADAALGYTGGAITQVDSSDLQNGRTSIDALDWLLDYRLSLKGSGFLDLHGAATWQPRFSRNVGLGVPTRDFAGSLDGAPRLRANAGARWTKGPLSVSIDGQLIGSYRITSAIEFFRADEGSSIMEQGGDRIPAQASLDLALEYRISLAQAGLAGRPRTLTFRFGIQDLLDARPAYEITAPGFYNSFLDARRRRFELTIAAGF